MIDGNDLAAVVLLMAAVIGTVFFTAGALFGAWVW